MEATLNTLREQVVLFLPQLAASIVLFLIFWLVARGIKHLVLTVGRTANLNQEVRELIGDIASLAIIAFGIVTALGTLGINVTALVAGLGLTGFALGFALHDIIANTLSGILILMYQPFKIGDYVTVAGNEGTVSDINLRYTTLRGDTNWILVPNQTLFKESIKVSEPGAQPPEQPEEAAPEDDANAEKEKP